MKSFYKYYIFCLLINPFTYISAGIFYLFVNFHFFYFQSVISIANLAAIHRFYSSFPYGGIFLIPTLASVLPSLNPLFSVKKQLCAKLLSLASLIFFILFFAFSLPLIAFIYGSLDFGQFLSAALGLTFNFFALISVSLFFNTLIKQKALSLVFSVIASAFIPMALHVNSFEMGIFDSRDFVFYFSISFIFLFLTFYFFEKKRANTNPILKKILCLSLAGFFLMLADSHFFYTRIDLTKNKIFSLSSYSKNLLQEIDQPFTIEYYRSSQAKKLFKETEDINDFLRIVASENKNISYKLYNADSEQVKKRLESSGIKAQPVRTSSKEETSLVNVYSVIVLSYLGQTLQIPFITSLENLEYSIIEKTLVLVRKTQRPVQVVFAYGQASINFQSEDFLYLVNVLQSQGFTLVQTFLPSQSHANRIPFTFLDQIPLLVLGSEDFTLEDAQALTSFIKNGGKVFIAANPFNISDEDLTISRSNLNLFYALQEFGLYFKDTSLIADSKNFTFQFLSGNGSQSSSSIEYKPFPYWIQIEKQKNAPSGLIFNWVDAIDFDTHVALQGGFEVSPYIYSQGTSWLSDIDNPIMLQQEAEEGDEKGPFSVALSLCPVNSADSSPNAVFLGGYLSFSNKILNSMSSNVMIDTRSLDFVSNVLLRISGYNALVQLKEKSANLVNQNFSSVSVKKLMFLSSVIPLIVLVFTAVLWHIKRYFFNKRNLFE